MHAPGALPVTVKFELGSIVSPLRIDEACMWQRGIQSPISDHQQSWRYEDGPWKGPGHLCWWPLVRSEAVGYGVKRVNKNPEFSRQNSELSK